MNQVIVNDISKWQDRADFRIMRQKSAGVILRAGPDSNSWEDVRFREWRNQAESLNFPYGNYWYYLGNVSPKLQAEYWSNIIGNRHGVLGCWLDLEDAQKHEHNNYLKWWDCLAYFKQLQPSAVVGIYTRASYFNDPAWRVPSNHAFRNLPLWVAHYGAAKPDLPKGWTDWTLWQFTDSGDGLAHGVGSREIDMNYYKGDIITANKPDMIANFGNVKVEYQESK